MRFTRLPVCWVARSNTVCNREYDFRFVLVFALLWFETVAVFLSDRFSIDPAYVSVPFFPFNFGRHYCEDDDVYTAGFSVAVFCFVFCCLDTEMR